MLDLMISLSFSGVFKPILKYTNIRKAKFISDAAKAFANGKLYKYLKKRSEECAKEDAEKKRDSQDKLKDKAKKCFD